MSRIINKIYIEDKNGIDYLLVKHSDKTYAMPCSNVKQGMEFYVPTTIKGKMYKAAVKKLFRVGLFKNRLGVEIKTIKIDQAIDEYIAKTFDEENFEVAFYTDETDSVQNDKVTIMALGDNPFGYMRLVQSEETRALQKSEFDNIIYLEKKSVKNIPYVIGIEEIEIDGEQFCIRSEKPINGKFKLSFNKKVVNYIQDIVKKTSVDIAYEETDFYKYVSYLKQDDTDKETNNRQLILEQAIEYIDKNKDELEFAFAHGDYTPWNIRHQNDSIVSFDFEYSKKSMPKYIDIFHFLTQREVLARQADTGRSVHAYKKEKQMLKQYMNTRLTYICYLVYIISFYKQRTNKESEMLKKQYRIWFELLEYLLDSK